MGPTTTMSDTTSSQETSTTKSSESSTSDGTTKPMTSPKTTMSDTSTSQETTTSKSTESSTTESTTKPGMGPTTTMSDTTLSQETSTTKSSESSTSDGTTKPMTSPKTTMSDTSTSQETTTSKSTESSTKESTTKPGMGPATTMSDTTSSQETSTTTTPACQEDPRGLNYRGNLSQTINGHTCQAWTSQYLTPYDFTPANYPNAGLDDNYCRNPDGTTSTCLEDPRGVNYRGNLSQTIYGHTCQAWTSQDPNEHTTSTCLEDPRGVNYRGNLSQTIYGHTCQAWTSQDPNEHSRTPADFPNAGLDENYCRNPDNSYTAWCYTTNPRIRRQFCAVGHFDPRCQATSTCLEDPRGVNYRGNLSQTIYGHTCQAWTSQDPNEHSRTPADFPNAGLDENYCRNPDNSYTAWCYTTNPRIRWQFCALLLVIIGFNRINSDSNYYERTHNSDTQTIGSSLKPLLNAEIGDDASKNWKGTCGQYCNPETNTRGLRLLEFAKYNYLKVVNAFGPHKPSRRWIWHSPGGQYHNQIDDIMVKGRSQSSANIVKNRSFSGGDVGSDHDLVMMTFRLRLQRMKSQGNKINDRRKVCSTPRPW
ncbi:plasminogen-like [Strongylocentrotus purpuratus]|uniref:Kringle domain-containing protein n=1 Tax=Strongylocentrotus purpuratus TaxID=7668 RepID=A0A7M7P7U6_STRPU|nr:plasminogen-like [Strongylocentrotus purpuratus]